MKRKPSLLALLAISTVMPALAGALPIVPKPAEEVRLEGHFTIGPDTVIRFQP